MSREYLQLHPCCSLCSARLQLAELAIVPGASVTIGEEDRILLSCPAAELPGEQRKIMSTLMRCPDVLGDSEGRLFRL